MEEASVGGLASVDGFFVCFFHIFRSGIIKNSGFDSYQPPIRSKERGSGNCFSCVADRDNSNCRGCYHVAPRFIDLALDKDKDPYEIEFTKLTKKYQESQAEDISPFSQLKT